MKLNPKAKIVLFLLCIVIYFAFLPLIINNPRFIIRNRDITTNYSEEFNIDIDKEDLKSSILSETIHIVGNSGWVAFRSAGICSGSGTPYSPYVIKNLIIDGKGSGPCIYVRNSSVYFRIDNCILYNSGDSYGILLVEVNNSQVINNYCYNNEGGITIVRSEYNTILGNNVFNNNGFGIELHISNNNVVKGNKAKENDIGIYITGINNEISGNTAKRNTYGIYVYGDYNIVSGNTINENYETGIYLNYCQDNEITKNTVSDNIEYGISLQASQNNEILENTVKESEYGIWLFFHDHDNNISRNIIYSNMVGIVLWSPIYISNPYNNSIYYNCLIDNTYNCYDNGTNNRWDDGTRGNYWNNHTGLDEDGDGIGDIPHSIDGEVGAQDNFPLIECPISSTKGKVAIPGFNLFFLIGILSVALVVLLRKIKKS
jgi:nitrous oxidase accessory protein